MDKSCLMKSIERQYFSSLFSSIEHAASVLQLVLSRNIKCEVKINLNKLRINAWENLLTFLGKVLRDEFGDKTVIVN